MALRQAHVVGFKLKSCEVHDTCGLKMMAEVMDLLFAPLVGRLRSKIPRGLLYSKRDNKKCGKDAIACTPDRPRCICVRQRYVDGMLEIGEKIQRYCSSTA